MVIGRFAPSPSGRMHLGNVFSALLSWLSVRSQNGTLLLRIEDLDPARCRPEYAIQLKDDLRWLGLDWDRETQMQSQRSDIYRRQFERLVSKGLVYPCFCSRNELHAASAPHSSDGSLHYSGRCRNLTPEEIALQTRTPAWRLMVPDEKIEFHDGLQGEYVQNLQQSSGDFIIRRSDGVYAYQLAVVCDDALSGVTEVVRGCDLLSSTPRQLYLYRLLDFSPPCFYHVPLLTSASGRRLSKRDRDLDLSVLRHRVAPEALIGQLAFWAGLIDRPEAISLKELLPLFSWKQVVGQKTIVVSDALDFPKDLGDKAGNRTNKEGC